jgi:hypothetical protein
VSARTETDEYGAFVRRVLRAYRRRVGDRDIAALAGLAALSSELDEAMRAAVTELRANGYSWADIGGQLGVTRQAAQMRYGR